MHQGRSLSGKRGSAATAIALWAGAALAQSPSPPLPPPRPDRPAVLEPDATPAMKPGRPGHGTPGDGALSEAAGGICANQLTRLGVRFEPRPSIEENACSVEDPVLVSGLPDGLEVAPPALVTCPLAEALARWTLEVVSAEADRQLQTAPTKILVGTSYECRNQRSGSKLSEHAFGNGVDVMGFAFWRRDSVPVGGPWNGSPEAAFQAAIQRGACAYFSTVLGPGSDEAHGDHLHLDLRGRKGGYRICQ